MSGRLRLGVFLSAVAICLGLTLWVRSLRTRFTFHGNSLVAVVWPYEVITFREGNTRSTVTGKYPEAVAFCGKQWAAALPDGIWVKATNGGVRKVTDAHNVASLALGPTGGLYWLSRADGQTYAVYSLEGPKLHFQLPVGQSCLLDASDRFASVAVGNTIYNVSADGVLHRQSEMPRALVESLLDSKHLIHRGVFRGVRFISSDHLEISYAVGAGGEDVFVISPKDGTVLECRLMKSGSGSALLSASASIEGAQSFIDFVTNRAPQ